MTKKQCLNFKVYIYGKNKNYFVKKFKNKLRYECFKNLQIALNKIISALQIMHYDDPDYVHDKALSGDFFQEFMRRQLNDLSHWNNWFLPQHQFLSPKTHYWKYEWGFGKKFRGWVYDKTGIEIKLQEVNYASICPTEVKTQKTSLYNLSRRSKKNIKEFYKKDYHELKYNWWLF